MATQASDFFEPQPRATLADELAAIIQRAHALTNASGAATAIRDANSNNFVCRASSGSDAPQVGTALRVEGTFTGMCIQSAKELICDDAATDARVDTSAICALGIRSIAVTPIKQDAKVIGVLAVFSPKAHAFTPPLVGVLNALADQITGLLRKERRFKEERREPSLSLAKPLLSEATSPVVLTPPESPTATIREMVTPTSASQPAVSKAESIWATPGAPDTAPVALLLEAAEQREQKGSESASVDYQQGKPGLESAPAVKPNFDPPDSMRAKPAKARPDKFLVIGATLAVLALVGTTVGLLRMRNRGTATPIPAIQQPEHSGLSAPSTRIASDPARQTGDTVSNRKPESVERGIVASKRSETARKINQPGKSAQAGLVTVGLSDSKIKVPSVSPQNETQDIASMPSLDSSSASDLTLLARPASSSPRPFVAKSDLVNAKVIHAAPAIYPAMAKPGEFSGTVILKAKVGKDGKVTKPKVISGPPVLRNAAIDAVKQWLFQPAMLNGQPIEQETRITVNFRP